MDLSQLDFGAYPEAHRRTIYLQPTGMALRNDHLNKSVDLAGMDPWRFAGGTIKIAVVESKWPPLSRCWLKSIFQPVIPWGGRDTLSISPNAASLSHKQSFYNEKKGLEGIRVT